MTTKNENPNEVPRTGHIYDGIEELDHPVPNWFQAMFYITIFFGVGYFFYYSIWEGPSLTKEYERARLAEEVSLYEKRSKEGGTKVASETDLLALLKNPEIKKKGSESFQAKCASCHGNQGQGGIGPNLTDHYWLHGGKMTEVLATITQGVAEKGMPPWGPVLSGDEIQTLAVFIRSIADSNPPGAKAPQGELVKPE